MDNQHKHIQGCRDLSAEEIAAMNQAKAVAEQVGQFCEKLKRQPTTTEPDGSINIDQRWLAMGVTDLQKGFMAVIRSIARPESF